MWDISVNSIRILCLLLLLLIRKILGFFNISVPVKGPGHTVQAALGTWGIQGPASCGRGGILQPSEGSSMGICLAEVVPREQSALPSALPWENHQTGTQPVWTFSPVWCMDYWANMPPRVRLYENSSLFSVLSKTLLSETAPLFVSVDSGHWKLHWFWGRFAAALICADAPHARPGRASERPHEWRRECSTAGSPLRGSCWARRVRGSSLPRCLWKLWGDPQAFVPGTCELLAEGV